MWQFVPWVVSVACVAYLWWNSLVPQSLFRFALPTRCRLIHIAPCAIQLCFKPMVCKYWLALWC